MLRTEIFKAAMRLRGSSEVASSANKASEAADIPPVIAKTADMVDRLNPATTVSLALVLLVNSLSFSQNWAQLIIIVTLAMPIVIQFVMSMGLVIWCLANSR